MPIPGQPPPSPVLTKALALLAANRAAEAEKVVRSAAVQAKAQHGSGSPALARAYGDMARLHYRTGDFKRAANEFRHACEGPVPADTAEQEQRLTLMLGYAASLEALGTTPETDRAYRRSAAFAKQWFGAGSVAYAITLEPLARLLANTGHTATALRLVKDAFTTLWNLNDARIVESFPTRAEILKASGSTQNAFAELGQLPDDLIAVTVARVLRRVGDRLSRGRVRRAVFADLLAFLDTKYGDGHATTCDTLAAIVHHEAILGDHGDVQVRTRALRRAVWSYLVRRVPTGLVANLDVAIESDGTIHLAPVLARDPALDEAAELEQVLGAAVDDLYRRAANLICD